jgi:hypothetical protein
MTRIISIFLRAAFLLLMGEQVFSKTGISIGNRYRLHHARCHTHPILVLQSTSSDSSDPIDPLEGSPDTSVNKYRPKTKNAAMSQPNSVERTRKPSESSSKPRKAQGFPRATPVLSRDDDKLTLDQKILLSQAEILRTLPLDYFLSFRNICEQLVPRFGVYSVAFHVILLIPIIRIVKFQLNASVYPFLYIGPALFLVPYIFFWLWENDVCKVPIFDTALQRYVEKQKKSATKIFKKEEAQLMKLARNSGDQETIKKIANLSLLSAIDIENFVSEITAIKKRIKGRSAGNSTLSTFSQDNSAVSDVSVNFNDNINDAVKSFVEASLLGDQKESEKSLLEKLKQLEKDLDSSS